MLDLPALYANVPNVYGENNDKLGDVGATWRHYFQTNPHGISSFLLMPSAPIICEASATLASFGQRHLKQRWGGEYVWAFTRLELTQNMTIMA